MKQENKHAKMTYNESDGDRWTRGAGVIWRLLTGFWIVARHLMRLRFFILIFLCTHCTSGPWWPLPVLLLHALVSRGAAVLMETDEAVNSQTGGEQSGIGSAARCRRGGGSRDRLP